MAWYQREGPLRGSGAPVVGVLLYRKHVITQQEYIPQLIRWGHLLNCGQGQAE
jgi:magnesium chelatase subunit H